MAEIINTFLKGKMNQDLDSRILPNGEYREATNLSISRSESSTVGQFENILGNYKISELSASVDTEIIGSFVDENSNVAYLFATDYEDAAGTRAPGTAECYIFSVDLSAVNPPTVLVQGSFLNFNKSFIFTGINLIENLLFFTDNLNQPRKINVESAGLDIGYYTNEDQISVAKYAPYEPILVMERNTTIITAATSPSDTITPDSMTGIKVGDIITDNNKIDALTISDLVTVIGIPTATTLTLSEAITVTGSPNMDFSRPSMTNQTNPVMSNHSSGLINTITNGGSPNPITAIYRIQSGSTADRLYNGKNGIPRIGDLVSCTNTPGRILPDTRVTSVEVRDNANIASPKQYIEVTLDKETTLVAMIDTLSISDNPDYDINWSGDVDFLEDKFVRFSYRFRFADNEYSLIAPWSQVMFIPKQYGQFGGAQISPTEDMDNTYKSTIVSWFENNINNILLKIPMPYPSGEEMTTKFTMTAIDILLKESDALAIKVLETIIIPTTITPFPSISFYDSLNGKNVSKYFLDYKYNSSKPYKTLPSNQSTRVSDKVPVRALAQEVIGNRIVYGNYRDRHTAPLSINYRTSASNKTTRFDNYTQYPNHQLKQNRTYQVGFVLADRYGRQSDVILSSYDRDPNIPGSSVFHPYNRLTDQDSGSGLITNWLGNALKVQLDTAINSTLDLALGTPGLYSLNNPLGWFSYKIVVKQQEQDYYNVYLPGFINGYPVEEKVETNKSFFTTLASDNINKIPRDLKEVGPSDSEYNSSEILTIRVNNPNIDNKSVSTPPLHDSPWNTQYYPGNLSQRVLSVATVRDMEILAIPFKAAAHAGEYGNSGTYSIYTYDSSTPPRITSITQEQQPVGSIPWGKSAPDSPMYNADSNPLVVKINQSANVNNPIGGSVFIKSIHNQPPPASPNNDGNLSVVPFLSVAETKPVYSLLDIYWETSLSGNLETLNGLVISQYAGIVSADFASGITFSEATASETVIGAAFNFLNSVGAPVTSGVVVNSLTVTDAVGSTVPSGTFDLVAAGTEWVIKTGIGKTFFYNTNVAATPSTGIYTLTANVTYSGLTDNIVLEPFSLSNVNPGIAGAPTVTPSGLTTASIGTITTLTAVNGSADTTVQTNELVWQLDPDAANYVDMSTKFEFLNPSVGALAVKPSYTLVDGLLESVHVLAKDVNGIAPNALSGACTVDIVAGTQHVNKALCEGNKGTIVANCGEALQVQFLNSSTVSQLNTSVSVTNGGFTKIYPSGSKTYNVLNQNQGANTTGKLKQGTLYIQGSLSNTGATVGGNISVWYTIQVNPDSGGGWKQAQDTTANNVVYNNQITSTNGYAQLGTKHTFTEVGEYRVLTTTITGALCNLAGGVGGTSAITFGFGDDNFVSCASAPL